MQSPTPIPESLHCLTWPLPSPYKVGGWAKPEALLKRFLFIGLGNTYQGSRDLEAIHFQFVPK